MMTYAKAANTVANHASSKVLPVIIDDMCVGNTSIEFANVWLDDACSDCSVEVSIVTREGTNTTKTLYKRIPCHFVVLRSRWPFFKAKVQFHLSASSPTKLTSSETVIKGVETKLEGEQVVDHGPIVDKCERDDGKMVLELVASDELEARVLEIMVWLMYDPLLDVWQHLNVYEGSEKVLCVCHLIRLCDLYECRIGLARAWKLLQDDDVIVNSVDDACYVLQCLSNFPNTCSDPIKGRLQERAITTLMQVVADFERYWSNPANRQQFCQLPLHGLQLLLDRDDLAVVNENTIVVAVMHWLAKHPEVTREEVEDLRGRIRMSDVTQAFMFDLIESGQTTLLPVNYMLRCIHRKVDANRHSRGVVIDTVVKSAFAKTARIRSNLKSISFEAEISEIWDLCVRGKIEAKTSDSDKDKADYQCVGLHKSEPKVFGGYDWCMTFELYRNKRPDQVIRCFTECKVHTPHCDTSSSHVVYRVNVSYDNEVYNDDNDGARGSNVGYNRPLRKFEGLDFASLAERKTWLPYLNHEGKFVLKAEIALLVA